MRAAAMVLATDVEEAVTEVRRTHNEMGFLSAYLHPNPVQGRNWHNPVYDPLWQECQDLDVPVTFHETFKCSLPQAIADRFYNEPDHIWTMGHVACHPIEQMYACLCFCAGGILDKLHRAPGSLPRMQHRLAPLLALAYGRALRTPPGAGLTLPVRPPQRDLQAPVLPRHRPRRRPRQIRRRLDR